MALRTGRVIIARNIKLDKSYKNVIDYTETNMLNLVIANKVAESTSCSFLKPGENVIDTSFTYSDCLKCNYLALQNPSYSNKWFFAFIDEVEYINNGTTRIHYKVDIYSTWFDYIEVEPTFVIREHVNDDTIGLHTVPEGLETGEYIINSFVDDSNNTNLCCVVGSTASPGELANLYGGYYNGIPSGITYYRFDDYDDLVDYLQMLASSSSTTPEAVVDIFLAPKWLCGGINHQHVIIPTSNSVGEYNFTVTKITTLNGYIPKNNKLLTFPYIYTNLTNNQGSSAIIHQELWNDNNNGYKQVKVFGCLTPGCSIRAIPINYKGTAEPYDEGINLGKFPQLNWTTDQYTNWLTQNGVNIATSLLASGVTTAVSTVSGNPVGIGAGLYGISQTLGEVYKHSMTPPQAEGNINCGDVATASLNNVFTAYNMTIKQEYAKIIDDYFTMRGYKINSVKTPNLTGRTYYNYVQIAEDADIGYPNSNLYGIPASDMEEINNIYRRGVTIWHNHANIGNYSLDNTIVQQ